MPIEFWREVVDRVAQEAPDTLLLAEAFWLMEGYFVRTLGMHRVYNSAFMNLLRNEDNAKYRLIMKNTLEFDPEILKRYVNFMNNPDERTAVDQFGKGDKYFGIAAVMATLPGLPMFGHGQMEGLLREVWHGIQACLLGRAARPRPGRAPPGARYSRCFTAGRCLPGLTTSCCTISSPRKARSTKMFTPTPTGWATSTGWWFTTTSSMIQPGWVRTSVGFSVKSSDGERYIIQRTLGEGLNLHADPRAYCLFRDAMTGMEYIRPSREIDRAGHVLDPACLRIPRLISISAR